MSKVLVTESYLGNIADAIRLKNGLSTTYRPGDMAAAVEALDTSGIHPTGTKNITQNGTHDVTQYANVNVNVQPNLQSKTATENGTVTPDSGYDGLSEVVVNVSGGGGGSILTGTTPPDVALGTDGDFYVQTFTDGVLASDGACYINTGITPNALYAVEIVAAVTYQSGGYDTLFGTRNGSYARFTARFGAGTTGTLDVHKSVKPDATYTTWQTGLNKSTMLNTFYRVFVKDMLSVNGEYKNGTVTTSVAAFLYPWFLFANNNAGSASDYAYCAIKRFKVWDNNGVLVMYLVPSSHDGEACMYDLVTGQYYTNSGNGTFTYTDLGATVGAILWKKNNGVWAIVLE